MTAPTREELEAADCWFPADKITSPEITAFKREARYRQHLWAKSRGVETFGSHTGSGGQPTPNGTKLSDEDADAGRNFLSSTIEQVVAERLDERQDSQTLDPQRLRRDLLSSMPMAFNLFGEAARNAEARRALVAALAPDVEPAEVEVLFEWSPGRRDERFTRDRTAFDVALKVGSSPTTVIGIETKYHEHSVAEPPPNAAAAERHVAQTDFLVAIADESGVFGDGWKEQVLGTDLRQIWRDHLLALSMRKHEGEWSRQTRYVLVHPERNSSFAEAAGRYAKLLQPGDTSFTSHRRGSRRRRVRARPGSGRRLPRAVPLVRAGAPWRP